MRQGQCSQSALNRGLIPLHAQGVLDDTATFGSRYATCLWLRVGHCRWSRNRLHTHTARSLTMTFQGDRPIG